MRTHELKIWPSHFEEVVDRRKTFEIRWNNDRDFAVGDVLRLREWSPEKASIGGVYTGRDVFVTVTSIIHGGQFGIETGWCVMSIKLQNEERR